MASLKNNYTINFRDHTNKKQRNTGLKYLLKLYADDNDNY